MTKTDEIEQTDSCFNRARNDERLFVLLERDDAAPATIRAWAAERIRLGKNLPDDAQILEALEAARCMAGEPAEEMYYICNSGPVGNCARWWRIDGKGYTVVLDDAWRVTKARAESICCDRPTEDFPVSAALADLTARRHLDVQKIRSAS